MDDPALIAVFENGLHPKVKFLYSILHAYAGADGVAVVEEQKIAGIMQISPDRLRGYRSMLNKSGYCSVVLSGASLVFRMTGDHLARESDHLVITAPAPQPVSDHLARESDHLARESDHLARDGGDNRGGMNERVLSYPIPVGDLIQSIRPESEQKASVAILTDPDIRLGAWKARQIAQRYPFEDIRAYCCDYVAQGKRPLEDAGLIDWWLKNEPAPPLVENDLYQRHRTHAEIAADEQRQAEAAEENRRWEEREQERQAQSPAHQPPLPAPSPAPPAEAADIWRLALSDLAQSLPAQTYETWVRDTSVVSCTDGEFVIGVPHAHARDFLQSRLRPQVQRILGRLTQRPAEVSFAVRPRPNPQKARP